MLENFIKYSCEKNTKNLDKIINIDSIFRYDSYKNYCKSKYYCANFQFVRDVSIRYYKATLYNYDNKLKYIDEKSFNIYSEETKLNMMLQYTLFFAHMAYEYEYYVETKNISVLDLDENIYVLYKVEKFLYRLEVSKLLVFHPDNMKQDLDEYIDFGKTYGDFNEVFISYMLYLLDNIKHKTFLEKYGGKKFYNIINLYIYDNIYGNDYSFKNYINILLENDNIHQSNKDLRDFKYDKTLCNK